MVSATLTQVSQYLIRILMISAVLSFSPAAGLITGMSHAESPVTDTPVSPESSSKQPPQRCVVVSVPLPITLSVGQQIQRSLQVFAAETPAGTTVESRPIVMLEFQTWKTETGSSSDLGACLGLAEFLTSPAMSRTRTIAYISGDKKSGAAIKGQLKGHAVLVAIACSQIVMENNTAIGEAGAAQQSDASYIGDIYRGIAEKRYALPVEVVLSMLEKERGLFRVTTEEEVVLVGEVELNAMESAGKVVHADTLAPANQRAILTSEQLNEYRLIAHRVASKTELARKLGVAPDQLSADASGGGTWRALTIKVPDYLDQRTARWVVRSIKPAVGRHKANLLFLEMQDSVGDLEAGVILGRAIAAIDSADVKTVAVIKESARSGAALAALACDQLILRKTATLGGFEPAPGPNQNRPHTVTDSYRQSFRDDSQSIADVSGKDWSVMAAMIDDEVELARYREKQNGDIRLMSVQQWESLNDADQWQLLGVVDTVGGISADLLKQTGVAASVIEKDDEIKAIYQLVRDPKVLAPTASDRWVQSLAAFLTSPAIASLLIMGAFLLISTEMSAPGLGVPGFLGTLCLLGFFWAQYFDGNAEWFEILLFVIGVVFILMEIFVIPGFGVFGIGGTVMVCVSIVLAAQSFLVPLNIRDVEKLPNSLFPLVGAGFGVVAAAFLLPRIIPDTPFLKNVILSPPRPPELDLGGSKDTEATADFSDLLGSQGTAATKLMPSGRGQFGDRICDVITQGQVVEKGEAIEVIEAVANRVVVKKV